MSERPAQPAPSALHAGGYRYANDSLNDSHAYLMPELLRVLSANAKPGDRIFEIGAGNGSVADILSKEGYRMTGIEPSLEGTAIAKKSYPHLDISVGTGYDNLRDRFGTFPVVMSLEVIEHIYSPREFVRRCFELVAPGGILILSTPYHGYWKNLALAVTGRLDDHFTSLWEHGHIKFWSIRTLSTLLEKSGFIDTRFSRVGRVPILAKSMIAVARKPN